MMGDVLEPVRDTIWAWRLQRIDITSLALNIHSVGTCALPGHTLSQCSG